MRCAAAGLLFAFAVPACTSTPTSGRLSLPAPPRRPNAAYWTSSVRAPLHMQPDTIERNAVAGSFAEKVVKAQPGEYLPTVTTDVLHFFAPGRRNNKWQEPISLYSSATPYVPDEFVPERPPADVYRSNYPLPDHRFRGYVSVAMHGWNDRPPGPAVNQSLARTHG